MERPRNALNEVPRRAVPDDGELVARARLRDSDRRLAEDAYRVLVERYWKVVAILARGRVGSERDAEDIAQETFLKAFRSIDKLEDPQLFLGWLLRIAQNLSTDFLRRRRRETSLESLGRDGLAPDSSVHNGLRSPAATGRRVGMSPQERPGHEERVEREEDAQRVLEAMSQIPEPYQNVLVLRYLKGFSNAEIARRLGEPDGTIRNRLFRALRKVRELLETKATLKT